MKKFFIIIFLFLPFLFFSKFSCAQEFKEETLEAKINNVIEEKIIIKNGEKQVYQRLNLAITKGSLENEQIVIEVGDIQIVGQQKYEKGDKVLVSYNKDFEGNDVFYITDFVRRIPLLILFLVFALLTALIGKARGVMSLFGLGVTFFIILFVILPLIYKGIDPVLVSIGGSFIIIPVTFFLSHGFNRKTAIAVLATIISLVFVGVLAKVFILLSALSGFASEEAAFIFVAKGGQVNLQGILLAGIIIGALGILDDITVSQASIVQELKKANPLMKSKKLFLSAMNVGQDHIASMVNTLVLVYTGASLPLLLLFIDNPHPFNEIINYQIVAEEVVRTLVGSIGLVLAVPITTFLATRFKFRN
ncbi:MAG: YibE/F family protein [Patescibacteria group bacterium]